VNVAARTDARAETPASPAPLPTARWRIPLAALAIGTVLWGVLFRAEIAHAIHIYETDLAYNHGWLIAPIAAWLAWTRRHRLAALSPAPNPAFALLALPAALAWFVADRLGIMEGRQFAALGVLYAMALAVLGWRVALAMAAPLAYLVFMVPFGAFTVPALQVITARMVDWMLDFTGIPHYVDALLIEIPAGNFYVAEACAGLRFIIATLAFGALYALVMFRSPWRRLTVMVLALVVPIVANGMRAFLLVMLGHWWGSAAAVDADHVIYGWGFFSFVLILLILAGLPFREDRGPAPPLSGPGRPGRPAFAVPAVAIALLAAGAGQLGAARLDAADAANPPAERAVTLRAPDFCATLPDGALDCQGVRVTARLMLFGPGVNWDAVSGMRRALTLATSDQDVTFDVPLPEGGNLRGRQPRERPGTTAAGAFLDGRIVGDGIRSRATQALHAFRGGHPGGPVLLVIELQPESGTSEGMRERSVLRSVLEAQQGGLSAAAAGLSVAR
jgi:exosortase A